MSEYYKDFAKIAIEKAENNIKDCELKKFINNIKRATEQSYSSLYENDDRETLLNIDKKAEKLIDMFNKKCECSKK